MKLSCTAAAMMALVLACSAAKADAPAACPSEPMRVVRSRGGIIDYHGTVRGIPELCRITRNGEPGHYYFSVWRSDWPGAGLAYPVIRSVVLGGPGARGSFVTRSIPGMQWVDTYTNEGAEKLAIGGQVFETIRTAHERQGIEGNTYHSIITSWRDIRTGVTLKVHEHQIAGQSYGPDTTWEAVRVETMARQKGAAAASWRAGKGQAAVPRDE